MSPPRNGKHHTDVSLHRKQQQVYYEEKIRKVERLICNGITSTREIGIAVGLIPKEVSKICAIVYERWKADPNQEVQDRRLLRTKQLEVVLQKAHSAFERSCKDVEEFTTKQSVCRACNGRKQFKDDTTASGYSDCKSCNGVGMIITEEVTIRKKVGDPAFLHLAKEVVKELAKIDGIVTEKKVTVNNTLVHQSMNLGGEVEQSVRELYTEAPIETLMKAKLLLEELDLAEQKKVTSVKSQPGVVVMDKD